LTVSSSVSKTFSPAIATRLSSTSAGPERSARARLKASSPSICSSFSASEARATSISTTPSGGFGDRKVLTPMMGSSPLNFLCS
jgi:hypothetical protein